MLQDKRDFIIKMIRDLEKLVLRFNGIEDGLHFEELSKTIDKYLVEVIKVTPKDDENEIVLKMMDLSSKLNFQELELLNDVLIQKGKMTHDLKYLKSAYKILSEIEQKDIMTFSFIRQQKLQELELLIKNLA